MNLLSVSCCLVILVIASSCSCFYIPVRLIAKFIPLGAMYGGAITTNLVSKARIPTIRLGDHHDAVHVYPTEHTHKMKSHTMHAVHDDHHVVHHGHHHGHHIGHHDIHLGHHGHHGHHGLHGLHGDDHHFPGIFEGGSGGGLGGGLSLLMG